VWRRVPRVCGKKKKRSESSGHKTDRRKGAPDPPSIPSIIHPITPTTRNIQLQIKLLSPAALSNSLHNFLLANPPRPLPRFQIYLNSPILSRVIQILLNLFPF